MRYAPWLNDLTRRAGLILLLLALALAGGCAVFQNPGPDPAHLLVSARASVTPAMVEQTLETRANMRYSVQSGVEEVSDPLWDLRAFVPQPDGSLLPLKPVRPVENLVGYDLDATAEFLAPAGTYEVFFLLECSVSHMDLSGPAPMKEYIYLITWRHQEKLSLCPGCRVELSPFKDRSSRP